MTTGAGGGTGGIPRPAPAHVSAPYSNVPYPAFRTPSPMSQGPAQATTPASSSDAWVLGAQMFGTILQSYGAYSEAQAKAETLEYNAMVAEKDALQVEKAKKHELHKARTAQRRLLAKQIVATASSGRQMSGSPLDVMARSEADAQTDQRIIISNSAREQARLYGQSAFGKGQAKSTKARGRGRAFANLMVGGANQYAKSNYFKKSKG